MPFTFDMARVVATSPEAAWDLITDTTRLAEWSPAVTALECDDRHLGPDSTGRMQTAFGVWLPFTVTDFEQGSVWRCKVGGVSTTGHRIEPFGNDPGTCRVVFELPVWGAPYAPLCARALRQVERLTVAAG